MFKTLKDAFHVTNSNIILAVPLILFLKIIDLYSAYSLYNLDSNGKLLLAAVTILFMFGVLCSGWFYMVKKAVELSEKIFVMDSDRAKETLNLLKAIPEGIGKLFLPFVGAYIILFFVQLLTAPIVIWTGIHAIGMPDAETLQSIQNLAVSSSDAAASAFVDKMSPELLAFFGKWSLLLVLSVSLIMYILMFFVPEIVYKHHNPFVALFTSIKKLFCKFFSTFGLFLILWILGIILLFINTFSLINPFAYWIISIITFWFMVYVTVTIFMYYKKCYIDEADEQ